MIHLVRHTYNIYDKTVQFSQDDSRYLLRVRRVRIGDKLTLFAQQKRYDVTLSETEKHSLFAIIDKVSEVPLPEHEVTLVISVGERKAVELAVKNGVEAGAHHIVLVRSARSNATVADFENREERLRTIILSAASQAHRLFTPTLHFSQWSEMVVSEGNHYVFHPSGINASSVEIADTPIVWIGPEGGFSGEEIEQLKERGATLLSLPMPILRMENGVTAALTKIFLSF